MDAAFEIVDGRTGNLPFSETTRNSPIAETLAALRLAYERDTRYRRSDDRRDTPFETLRYKTGWVCLGNLAAAPGTYVEQPLAWLDGPTFEFADGREPLHAMPKRNDRIRLKEDTPVIILDYGATGETKRNVPPTAHGNDPGFKDSTGRHAEAGHSYQVADVRVAESDGNAPVVWVRLVAGR